MCFTISFHIILMIFPSLDKEVTMLLLLLQIFAGVNCIIKPPPRLADLTELPELVEDFNEWIKMRDEYIEFSKDYPMGWQNFGCRAPEKFLPALDAHHLAPWHISVIGALGDSITAAHASMARTMIETTNEYRGINFVTGGDDPLNIRATLANIFQAFNPKLIGFSKGISMENSTKAKFNLASSGAFSKDLMWEAKKLVRRIKADKSIDFDKDWKFINLDIGTNNLCYICKEKDEIGPEEYFNNLNESIAYLQINLPRTFLNLMPTFYIESLVDLHPMVKFCEEVHRKNCPCLFEMTSDEYAAVKRAFDEKLAIFNSAAYQREDFAVVLSPAINISKLPYLGSTPNLAFLAGDCFHFSVMAHDFTAKEIWSNLFEPYDNRHVVKDMNDEPLDKWECPPDNCPFLKTPLNSYNCSMAKYRKPPYPVQTFEIQYQSKVYLPSLNELERRANLNEQGGPLVLVLFAVSFLVLAFAAAGVILQRRRKETRKKQTGEDTPLLLAANLYDEELF